ncbi:MAG: hypothetical protein QXF26_08330 [Candidatus Bathyarchaeia archaeon]
MTNKEEETLRLGLEEASSTGSLTPSTRQLFSEVFGNRFRNAINSIDAAKVKKIIFKPSNRAVWLVSGKGKEHLILPRAGFCSCEDFYFRVISQEETLCYHLLAQKLAEALGRYSTTEEGDERYSEVVDKSLKNLESERRTSARETDAVRLFVAGALAGKELPLKSIVNTLKDVGFTSITNRRLAAILATDKSRRFLSEGGIWKLRSS